MGISLYFSNQLMPLADKLHQHLAAVDSAGSTLEPPVVIVPNMNLSKWIKLTLARQSGIFMNVSFQYLEIGLWQMMRSLAGQTGPEIELLDRECLKILLFFILMAPDRDAPELVPIQHYLRRPAGEPVSDREIRCWQLSEELARLFQEYEYHRSDMIQRWLDDRPTEDAMEGCQKWIYRAMTHLKDRLNRFTGRPLVSMVEYAREILDAAAAGQRSHRWAVERVHFFGLSQISPFHLQLVSRLESYFDIRIYSLNPSREYWEDIKTPYEKKWVRRNTIGRLAFSEDEIAAGDLFSPTDHALLSAWGKPGRESVRLLCQLTDYDFQAGFGDPPQPDTVLAAIGHGLLTLDTRDDTCQPLSQDTSLQIMACPGIRREVEAVYNSILHNLETDPQLCMTDIAVMVSDMSRYKPVVDSVFSRQPGRIAYNLVDSNARTESLFAQAVSAVMALSRGNFSRKQVFDLLGNPCVMQRWGYAPDDLSVWIDWADALGIFHGYENPTATDADGPSAGRFSWRQGLERMRLSRIMTSPDAPDDSPQPHFKGLIPFADMNTGNDRLMEKFCRLVASLDKALEAFRMASAPARTWRDAFYRLTDQFIEISADMRGEETVYQSLVQAFKHFVRYDDLAQVQSARPLTAEALWAFVRGHLEGITGGQGDYLTGGVTVSALMPMRPIPFKVVYVLGLEEGRFPGRVSESLLDLRTRQRRIGDITLAERNRYLFLEILVSVRSKLYLSYVSRDLQKDRDLAPCSVLFQLRRYVEQQILGGQAFQAIRIPINADHPAFIAPDAINDWSDVMTDASPAQRLSCYRRSGLWPAFNQRATTAELETAARFNPDFSLPDRSPDDESMPVVCLTTSLLRRFLLDPVDALGRYHLGIGEQADPTAELAGMEQEPLVSQFPMDYRIRTTPVRNWLADQQVREGDAPSMALLADAFETVYADLSRQSLVPDGHFGRHDRSNLKQQVLRLGANLVPFVEQMRSARQLFSAVVVGTIKDDFVAADGDHLKLAPVSMVLPAGKDPAPPITVQLNGGLPWVWQASDGTWHCLVVTGSNRKSRRPDKYILGPLLALMAVAAGGQPYPWSDVNRMAVHVVYREHVLSLEYRLEPQVCNAYLATLVGDFLRPAPMLWLPFEVLFSDQRLRALILADQVDGRDREMFHGLLTETMNATLDRQAELAGAVVTADSLDRARRRFRVLEP